MQYTVVTHFKLAEFEKRVMEYLGAGWTLVGGMSVSKEHGSEVFYQAMVKAGE
jgi:hypothetical protein